MNPFKKQNIGNSQNKNSKRNINRLLFGSINILQKYKHMIPEAKLKFNNDFLYNAKKNKMNSLKYI